MAPLVDPLDTPPGKARKDAILRTGQSVLPTPQDLKFVEFYLGECNGDASESASLSGMKCSGQAALSRKGVIKLIQDFYRDHPYKMSSAEILTRLSDIARGSVADVADIGDNGEYYWNLGKAKRNGKLHIVKKVFTTGETMQVELHDPIKAMDMLGKANRMWGDEQHETKVLNIFLNALPDDLRESVRKELQTITVGDLE